jgi:large conductance mechanosensitive channel
MLNEFKKFAVKGNMLDMAVGIIIGGAFGTIVKSLVSDVIMPPIGMLMGGVDFSDLSLKLQDAKAAVMDGEKVITPAVEAVAINYGSFINNVISFLIVAFAVFMLVKGMNKLKEKEEEAPKPAEPSAEEKLLTEIRDLMKANN